MLECSDDIARHCKLAGKVQSYSEIARPNAGVANFAQSSCQQQSCRARRVVYRKWGFRSGPRVGLGPQGPANFPVMDKKFYFTGKNFSEIFFSENTLSELAKIDCTRKTLFRWSEMRFKIFSHTLG